MEPKRTSRSMCDACGSTDDLRKKLSIKLLVVKIDHFHENLAVKYTIQLMFYLSDNSKR